MYLVAYNDKNTVLRCRIVETKNTLQKKGLVPAILCIKQGNLFALVLGRPPRPLWNITYIYNLSATLIYLKLKNITILPQVVLVIFTHSPVTRSLAHSLTHSLTHSFVCCFVRLFVHSFIHLFIHSL